MKRAIGLILGLPMCRMAIVAGALAVSTMATAHEPGVKASAITGDKIDLAGKKYCLYGIDAPETGQLCKLPSGKPYDCGRIATTALMDLLAGATVQCKPTGQRRGDCEVARCEADGFDLSANMVHTGWALADPMVTRKFDDLERRAKQSRHGLWRGRFQPPWKWRESVRRE
jgi:endonuclease YncB( thermonuclease family)